MVCRLVPSIDGLLAIHGSESRRGTHMNYFASYLMLSGSLPKSMVLGRTIVHSYFTVFGIGQLELADVREQTLAFGARRAL